MMFYSPAGYGAALAGTISSHDMIRSGIGFHLGTAAPANNGYPAANLALYVPFVLEAPFLVTETWVESGSLTTSNETEIGVYTTDGTRLFTTATTVATGSDTVNSSGMTDYLLEAGSYFLAFGCAGTRNFLATTLALGIYQSGGCLEETGLTGANLPSTATFAIYTRAFLPLFGLNGLSVAL